MVQHIRTTKTPMMMTLASRPAADCASSRSVVGPSVGFAVGAIEKVGRSVGLGVGIGVGLGVGLGVG